VRRIIESGFNGGDASLAEEVCDSQFVNRVCVHGVPMGPGGLRDHISLIRKAYPDLQLVVSDVIVDRDTVCVFWQSKGTAAGTYMGLDATGKAFSSAQIAFYTFAQDRLVDWRGTFDSMALFRAVTGQDTLDPIPAALPADVDPWAVPATESEVSRADADQRIQLLVHGWLGGPSDIDALGEIIGEWSALSVAGHLPAQGISAFGERRDQLQADFGPYRTELEMVLIDGSQAALRWILRGVDVGHHLNVHPTGRDVVLTSSALLRFEGNRLVEWREIFDDTGFVDQTKILYALTPTAGASGH
jgi:hypothetical protein